MDTPSTMIAGNLNETGGKKVDTCGVKGLKYRGIQVIDEIAIRGSLEELQDDQLRWCTVEEPIKPTFPHLLPRVRQPTVG